MSDVKQKPLFGSKKVEAEKETVVQETKVAETPMVTMSIEELEALIEKKVNAAKSPAPEVKQERVVSSEEKAIRNLHLDDIPELEGFEAKERMYVLCDGSKPEAREIKSRHKPGSPLQYRNKITNVVEALFFSLTQSSFFKSKHTGDSKVDHIFFKDGLLNTYEDDIKLQRFLHIHPDNEANGGSLFKVYNPGIEAESTLESEDILFEAQRLAREISFLKQESVARLLCVGFKDSWEPSEMKLALFNEVKRNPKQFIKLANDPRLEVKSIAKIACNRGFMEYRSYKFWDDQGQVVCDVQKNQNEWDVIADHFLSGTGRTYYEFLRNCID